MPFFFHGPRDTSLVIGFASSDPVLGVDDPVVVPGQAQRFLTVHGLVQNLFRVGRHLLQAHHHRELRDRAFIVWQEVTCAVR